MSYGVCVVAAALAALWAIQWVCSAGESFTRLLVRDLFLWLDK